MIAKFRCVLVLATVLPFAVADAAPPPGVDEWLDDNIDHLSDIYVALHRNPEVSYAEAQTADRIARDWRAAGYDVTTGVGGHGVVAILKNGAGPTLMLRADLDALPLQEKTGRDYASRNEGVMHACGHDIHMTNLTGVAGYFSGHREAWRGTLMLVGQPAEEVGGGAKAMLEDGLFERFEKPDAAIALHVSADQPCGTVGMRPGYALANVDSVDITMRGRGGHGSKPETTIDPVMMAAELVISLQTIVSRETAPTEPAVVTVGSIHGGTKHNIIGDDCRLQLTVRSYAPDVRGALLAAIRRKAEAVAAGYGADAPEVSVTEGVPSLFNDEDLTARVRPAIEAALGADSVVDNPPSMGGEDFSLYGQAGVPIVMFSLGSVTAERLERYRAAGVGVPSLHSSQYWPDPEETLRTGVRAMTAAAMTVIGTD